MTIQEDIKEHINTLKQQLDSDGKLFGISSTAGATIRNIKFSRASL